MVFGFFGCRRLVFLCWVWFGLFVGVACVGLLKDEIRWWGTLRKKKSGFLFIVIE